MATNRFRERALTPAQQAYFLRLAFPGFRVSSARNKLRSVGLLQPSVISDTYTVELEYEVPNRPKVQILKPQLTLAPGRARLPHVFDGNELCLHLTGEWRPDRLISDYVIPWISFWLYFYEVWRTTGEWLGGGHEPNSTKK